MAGSFLGGLVPTPDLPSASDLLGNNPFGGALNNVFPQDSMLGQLLNRNGSTGGAITMFWKNVGAYGTVPNNRFRLEITPPASGVSIDNERLSVACEEIQMPGKSIGTTDYQLQGPARQMPYEMIFQQEISMTFRLSDNMYERKVFEGWMNSIIAPTTSIMRYYDDYTTEMKLILVDDDLKENDVYQWSIHEVYPKSIGPIDLSQSNQGYARQTVTFNFRTFDTELLQTDLASGVKGPADFGLPSIAQNGGLLGEINDMTGGLSGAVINNYGTMLNDIF